MLEDVLVAPDLVVVHHFRRLELEVEAIRHTERAVLLVLVGLGDQR